MSFSSAPPPEPAAEAAVLIPSLPDDVALNCLARIPRYHHASLSAVSKPIRSLLSSPLFFATRSLLNSTQTLLYLSLRSPHLPRPPPSWFALHRNPNSTLPIPPIPEPAIGSAFAAVGPKIYAIGGAVKDVPSPRTWILDCRFHTWEPGPTMRVGREFAAAGVVDGKIYAVGGCAVDSWTRAAHWAEVLDPAEGRWEAVDSGGVEVREKWMHASVVVGGKVYAMSDRGGVVYDAIERVWGSVGVEMDLGWRGRGCVVNGVLYCYDYLGKIKGFDVVEGVWKVVKGVDGGLPKFLCGETMFDLGGMLLVVWEAKGNSGNGKEMKIGCTEIEVRKKKSRVEWGVRGGVTVSL